MSQVLKLGMIGAGFVAHFHARAIQQIRCVEIAGITSRTTASAEALSAMVKANGIGEGTVYSTIAEMADHVDAIAIFAPNYVRVEMVGRNLPNVVRVARTHLRDGDRVWVMAPDNTLDIRTVAVAWGGNDHVCVSDGLADGDRLIVSDLGAAVQGMALRLPDSGDATSRPAGAGGHTTRPAGARRGPEEQR